MGETARSRLNLGSARRAAPTIFSIREDSRHARVCLKRQRTAVSTTDFLCGFVPSCESLVYWYLTESRVFPKYPPLRPGASAGWGRRRVRA